MDRLILHIGTPKTGTTALQKFFWLNRDRLAAAGIDYPVFSKKLSCNNFDSFGSVFNNGRFLVMHGHDLLCAGTGAGKPPVRSEVESFRRCATRCARSMLLSAEGFYYGGLKEKFWSCVSTFLKECGFDHVELVVYLRRQDLYVVSLWKQRVKSRRGCSAAFRDFLGVADQRDALRYDTALARIEACFGRDAVIVRRYDPRSFVGGDIFHDFCAAINIPWDEGFVLPERRINPSLKCTVTEVKRLVNMAKSYRDDRAGNFLQSPALAASLVHPEPPGSTPLSPDEARALLAEYEEGNKRVAERYLGGEPLFPEPYEFGPTWKRDDAAVLDAAITMFAEVLAERQSRINRLERMRGMPLLIKMKGLITGLRNKS